MSKGQRRVRNMLLQPLLQIKLGLYNIILSIIFAVALMVILHSGFDRLFQFILDLTDARDQVVIEIDRQIKAMVGLLSLASAIYVGLIITVSIVYTHKLVGPTYAFRRHIRALMDGRYNSRITLRKSDAFSEVAEDLNQLAATLERQKK